MANIHVDVSAHQQRPIDSSYDLPFFMFRLVNEFGHIDDLAEENLQRSISMRQQGELVNFGGYVNPGHVGNLTFLDAIDQLGFPRDAVLMEDAEPWPQPNGQPLISGDHSVAFNDLAAKMRARQGDRADLVWGYLGYFNTAIWTRRPSWLGMITPWYKRAVRPPDYGHMIGWQYVDALASNNGTSYRGSTPPFGRCDHNVMFIDYPSPEGDDMPTAEEIAAAVWDHAVKGSLSTEQTAERVLTDTRVILAGVRDNAATAAAHSVAADTQTDNLAARFDQVRADVVNDVTGLITAGGTPQAVAEAVADLIADRLKGATA